ncbi:MAG: metallophosphoesterase [Phycisphaerales bacterium JB063]
MNRRMNTALLIASALAPCAFAEDPFMLVVLGDTQSYVVNDTLTQNFTAQTQWIADHAQSHNIRFVTHVGDIVEHDHPAEWDRADHAMSLLDPTGVPWSVAFGNHEWDQGQAFGGDTAFIEHFGPDRHQDAAWFGGASDNGRSTWQRFEAGGRTFLHITLEYDAPDHALAWGQSVLDLPENQGLPTILTTHVYLNDNRNVGFTDASPTTVQRVTRPYTGGEGRNSGEDIWQEFVSENDQIFMTFNGHYAGERLLVSTNDEGNPVYQMQVDYSRRPNGGDGWMKLLTFDPDTGEIVVQTYSPTLDEFAEFEPDANHPLTLLDEYEGGADTVGDGDAAYTITIDFDERYGPVPEPGVGAIIVPGALAMLHRRR